ncbi:hypothetical protein [Streptomyces sp. NPDC002788]
MSWKWEYAFGAEEAARTAPTSFLAEVESKADELVVYVVQITYLGF